MPYIFLESEVSQGSENKIIKSGLPESFLGINLGT